MKVDEAFAPHFVTQAVADIAKKLNTAIGTSGLHFRYLELNLQGPIIMPKLGKFPTYTLKVPFSYSTIANSFFYIIDYSKCESVLDKLFHEYFFRNDFTSRDFEIALMSNIIDGKPALFVPDYNINEERLAILKNNCIIVNKLVEKLSNDALVKEIKEI